MGTQRGHSSEYPQSIFLIKIKKNWYTPAYSIFHYMKLGFKGVFMARTCYPDEGYYIYSMTSQFALQVISIFIYSVYNQHNYIID